MKLWLVEKVKSDLYGADDLEERLEDTLNALSFAGYEIDEVKADEGAYVVIAFLDDEG